MDEFARRPQEDRLAFISEAAARRDVTPIIIEKDFWVCWTLRRMMEIPVLAENLTFKGGTSLSKAYAIIERFSEDIDLTIGKNAPLIAEIKSPMEEGISGNERQRRTKALKSAAKAYVQSIAMPELTKAITISLGATKGWSVTIDPDDPDEQTILFEYPTIDATAKHRGANGYILPRIKLEFGARGEGEPATILTMTSYLAQDFPDELPDAQIAVSTLSAERTFWEKVTILHALHHGGKLRPGMSRHYYDTLKLAEKGIADAAMKNPELLTRVVLNKSLMFADAKASYETAAIGTLKLLPEDELRTQLAQDYSAMEEMFMSSPPGFDDMMASLGALEAQINGQI